MNDHQNTAIRIAVLTDGKSDPTDGGWSVITLPVQQENGTLEEPVEKTPPLIIESTLELCDETTGQEAEPVGDGMVSPGARRSHGRPLLLVGVGAMLTALVLGVILMVLPAWTSSTATVTIIPAATSLHTTTTVQVVAGPADVTQQQIPGRFLPTITLSEAQTVATTGIGAQHAQAAMGSLTFYNAAPYSQTVLAGTVLIGADGVQVVTDQEAVIPAASFPTDGVVSVLAHTLVVGSGGNIAAHDLYGACCRENVFVVNPTAFTGGQIARSFPMVTAHDLSSTVALLRMGVQNSVQAALATQLLPTETLITPLACTVFVLSNHAVGMEATQVHVLLTQTCRGAVYSTQALQTLMTQQMSQQATAQLGTSYHLLGSNVQTSIIQVQPTHASQRIVSIQVRGQSTWVSQFSPSHLSALTALIAGKLVAEATTQLLRDPGIQTVSLHVTGRDSTRLPPDPHAIHLVIVTLP